VLLRERTRLLVGGGGGEGALEIVAAEGTELRWAPEAPNGGVPLRPELPTAGGVRPSAAMRDVDGVRAMVVTGLDGALEVPLPLGPDRLVPMAVSVRGDWRGELRLTQRRGDGAMSPGYTIRR
jgi:hypothetical protein